MLSPLLPGVCRYHSPSISLPTQQVPPSPWPGLSFTRLSSARQILQRAPHGLSHVPALTEICPRSILGEASSHPAQPLKVEGDYSRFQS